MTLAISGEKSGVGKTTVTLALLSFLSYKGYRVHSFKVGPDYIDPMFHSAITNYPCRNLDPVLTSNDYVRSCFAKGILGADYGLVEGVMGLFDGKAGDKGFGSTAHVAKLLGLPVILTLDCSKVGASVAAIVYGFRSFDPKVNIVGLVLNKVGSSRHLEILQDALAELNVPILGVIQRDDNINIPSRHLGLIPFGEISKINTIVNELAAIAQKCFDWEKLLPLLRVSYGDCSDTLRLSWKEKLIPVGNHPRIAVAYDAAFNFYYQDNLDIWEDLGAEIVKWSPLHDSGLPNDIDGMYFGGGFPEVFASDLTANQSAIKSVLAAVRKGIPTLAECGGLMYLSEAIVDFEGGYWEMVGVLPTTAVMGKKLILGYRHAIAMGDNLLLKGGDSLVGHEFHRSYLTNYITKEIRDSSEFQPLFSIEEGKNTPSYEGWGLSNVYASYIHFHFGGNLSMAKGFLTKISSI